MPVSFQGSRGFFAVPEVFQDGAGHGFDAAHAKCFLVEDQERLLAIVEAGFGSLAPFSALIRGIFRDARATHLEVKIDKLQASNDELHAKLDRLLSAK